MVKVSSCLLVAVLLLGAASANVAQGQAVIFFGFGGGGYGGAQNYGGYTPPSIRAGQFYGQSNYAQQYQGQHYHQAPYYGNQAYARPQVYNIPRNNSAQAIAQFAQAAIITSQIIQSQRGGYYVPQGTRVYQNQGNCSSIRRY